MVVSIVLPTKQPAVSWFGWHEGWGCYVLITESHGNRIVQPLDELTDSKHKQLSD